MGGGELILYRTMVERNKNACTTWSSVYTAISSPHEGFSGWIPVTALRYNATRCFLGHSSLYTSECIRALSHLRTHAFMHAGKHASTKARKHANPQTRKPAPQRPISRHLREHAHQRARRYSKSAI